MIRIVLAGEPVGKGRPRFARATGRVYTPQRTERYESALRWAAQAAMTGAQPLEGPLRVRVEAYMCIPASASRKKRALMQAGALRPTKAPDGDNLLKALDSLNKIVWVDDAQVVSWTVEKWWSEQPRIEILVQEWLTACGDALF